MNLLEKITKHLPGFPDTIQFAKDRKFEAAWIINKKDARPSAEVIRQYINAEKFELLIVEYIWNSLADDKRFVLTIFFDATCVLKDPLQFMHISLDCFYHELPLQDIVKEFNQKVIGNNHLFNCPVEAVNIGIFNHWLSTNPLDLWSMGQDYSETDINVKLRTRPDLLRTNLNYQGLQFRFNLSKKYQGPYFGFKTPCCHKENGQWVVDADTVNNWISTFLN